jgi:hypothetical protein
MLAWHERRAARTQPGLVRAHVAKLIELQGRDGFRLNDEAMYEAAESGNCRRHRFLCEVSSELVARLAGHSEARRTEG